MKVEPMLFWESPKISVGIIASNYYNNLKSAEIKLYNTITLSVLWVVIYIIKFFFSQ